MLGVVSGLGLDMPGMLRVLGVVFAYVFGVAGYESAEAEADRRTGLTDDQKRAAVSPYLDTLLAGGRYPHLARFLNEPNPSDPDAAFDWGLDAVLAGLEAQLGVPVGLLDDPLLRISRRWVPAAGGR